MSAYGSADLAVEAMRRGAYDYLAKPFQPSEVLLTLRKAARAREAAARQPDPAARRRSARWASGRSWRPRPRMIQVLELVERAAEFKATVLLQGESGTGKEVLARAHPRPVAAPRRGLRRGQLRRDPRGRCSRASCSGTRRAPSPAPTARAAGSSREADGGTLFLDEIGELPLPLQAKLLRVLQEEEVRPVGESKPRRVDVRVIAATARDLDDEVAAGRFREDLFYRLDVVRVEVPPLRERREDIPLLVDHFLGRTPRGASARPCAASTTTPSSGWSATTGRATCASSRTCSSAP